MAVAARMILAWLRRHPLSGYCVLAFGISWVGILLVMSTTGFELSAPQPRELGLLFVMMLLGPGIAGLTLLRLLDGRAGWRELWARLLRWRVGVVWYALALLTAPLLLLAILLPLSIWVSPAFAPRFQWAALAVGLVAACFEEIGWTGFATPRLLARHRIWLAGLWLGLVWALWHLPVDFRYNADAQGAGWIVAFAVVYLATLTPYRLLMTWLHARTPSLLLAVLMHASYTGSLLALVPATTFAQGLVWQSAFAIALWAAACLLVRNPTRSAFALLAQPATLRPGSASC